MLNQIQTKTDYWSFKNNKPLLVGLLLFLIVGVLVSYKSLTQKKVSGAIKNVQQTYASEIPGWWLHDYFSSSVCEKDICKSDADPDGDKLTNYQEYYFKTNPLKMDTNGNGLTDGEDVSQGFDPSKPGKVLFKDASSDDEILGESLLYDKDVKKIIADMTDLSKVQLPVVNDNLLIITNTNTKEAIANYMKATEKITNQYFPSSEVNNIGINISSKNSDEINQIKSNSLRAVEQLEKVPVPQDALALHKYTIGLFLTIPTVVDIPPQEELLDSADAKANYWYDQSQIYSALMQKMNLEQLRLAAKYK